MKRSAFTFCAISVLSSVFALACETGDDSGATTGTGGGAASGANGGSDGGGTGGDSPDGGDSSNGGTANGGTGNGGSAGTGEGGEGLGGEGGGGDSGESGQGGTAGVAGSGGSGASAGSSSTGGNAGAAATGGMGAIGGAGASGAAGSGAAGGGGMAGRSSIVLDGSAQKGPLLTGSDVRVAIIDAAANPTGTVFSTTTTDDQGRFSVVMNQSGSADLTATGFYFNEISGALSGAPIALHALADLDASSAQQSVFVNALTHMATNRGRRLMQQGLALSQASAQAESELRDALGIFSPANLADGSDLDLLGGDNADNAYLLALSCILGRAALDGASSPAEVDAKLQELVNLVAADLGPDGAIAPTLADRIEAGYRNLDVMNCSRNMRARLDAIGSTAVVPDIRRAIDWDGDATPDLTDDDADGDGLEGEDDVPLSLSIGPYYDTVIVDRNGGLWTLIFDWSSTTGELTKPRAGPQFVAQTDIVLATQGQTYETSQGYLHYAVKRDGTMLTWRGMNYAARRVVSGAAGVSTAHGSLGAHYTWDYAIALKNDGTVLLVRGAAATATPIAGLTNVARVVMGMSQILVLFRDGTVGGYFTAEDPPSGRLTIFPGLHDIVDIAASWDQAYAIDDAGKTYTFSIGYVYCNPALPWIVCPANTTCDATLEQCMLSASGISEITEPSGLAFVSRGDASPYVFANDAQGRLFYLTGGSVVAIPSLGDVVAATVRGGHVLAATSDGGVSFMSFVYSNGNYVANTPKAIHVPH